MPLKAIHMTIILFYFIYISLFLYFDLVFFFIKAAFIWSIIQ